ncbi:MAG: hypothetical protein ACKPKO_45320, partial [Candidatus Fonsibacter sp.]
STEGGQTCLVREAAMKGGRLLLGTLLLHWGGRATYMNLSCEACPGSGNNDHGNGEYNYIMMII